jgi:hypothetical protein
MDKDDEGTTPPAGDRRSGKDRRRWGRLGAPDRRLDDDRRKKTAPGAPKRRSTDPK